MEPTQLLVVFLGIISVALAIIAGAFMLMAWHAARLLMAFRSMVEELHRTGRIVAGDVQVMYEKLRKSEWGLGSIFKAIVELVQRRRRSWRAKSERVKE